MRRSLSYLFILNAERPLPLVKKKTGKRLLSENRFYRFLLLFQLARGNGKHADAGDDRGKEDFKDP